MPKTLLLADDSITIQKVVGITFAGEDFRVTAVDNGEDGLARARELKPDVILADVVMPKKNGYELCEAIKSDPALSHIPVLLLAGTFEAFDEGRAKAARADAHISKPFESQALINKVKELVGLPVSVTAAGSVPWAVPQPVAAKQPKPAATPAPLKAPAVSAARLPPPPGVPPVAKAPVALHPDLESQTGKLPLKPAAASIPVTTPAPAAAPPLGGQTLTTWVADTAPRSPVPAKPAGLPPVASRPPPAAAVTPLPPPPVVTAVPPAPVAPPPAPPAPVASFAPLAPPPRAPEPPPPAALPHKAARMDPFGLDVAPPSRPAPPPPAPLPPPPKTEEELDWSDIDVTVEEPVTLTPIPLRPAAAPVPAPAAARAAPPPAQPQQLISLDELDFSDVSAASEPKPVPRAPKPKGIELPLIETDMIELAPASEFVPIAEELPRVAPRPAERIELTPLAAAADGGEAALRSAISQASREVIEKIAWEVVPQLAETIIREQLDRLAKERQR